MKYFSTAEPQTNITAVSKKRSRSCNRAAGVIYIVTTNKREEYSHGWFGKRNRRLDLN